MTFSVARSFALGAILVATGCAGAGTTHTGTTVVPTTLQAHSRAARDYTTNPPGHTVCGAGSAPDCVSGAACNPLAGLDAAAIASGAQCIPNQTVGGGTRPVPVKGYPGDTVQKIDPQCSSIYGKDWSLYHDCYVYDQYVP